MDVEALAEIARRLVGAGKGLLAMDESTGTCDKRLSEAGIAPTVEMRRAWRDLIVTTPGLGDAIAGAILFDETMRQTTLAGAPFPKALAEAGIIVGIKVDAGAKPLAGHDGETVTEGLDGLRERLAEYAGMGARFAKWRAVFSLRGRPPSRGGVRANVHALARYAALCQEAGMVPIVEPEVLMDGDHSMAHCRMVTEAIQHALFEELNDQGVALEGVILKPNMITPGADSWDLRGSDEIAQATLLCLSRTVPAATAGVAFLSGGQSGPKAAANLNAINLRARDGASRAPWPLTYSFARAIQHPALDIWAGKAENIPSAQAALARRAHLARATLSGAYDDDMESEARP
jgi:fructose-bisphosphate aldolase class I